MDKKFKETTLPEDYVNTLDLQHSIGCTAANAYKVITSVIHGVSTCLNAIKDTSVPKAVVFRGVDGSFIGAGKVEFMPNKDDPKNPSSGRWDYTWTFYEDDIAGADVIDVSTNSMALTYFTASAANLFNMRFNATDICVAMCTVAIEAIRKWLMDNTTTTEPESAITLEGVFKGTGSLVDGKIEIGLVPAGEMKVLIKDDKDIQEK